MKCSSKSFQDHAERQIAIYSAMLDYCETLKEVARKFDGKVLNKRFTNALTDASPETHPYWYAEGATVKCFYASFSPIYDGGKVELKITCHYLNGDSVTRGDNYYHEFYGLDPEGLGNEWYGNRMDAEVFASRVDTLAVKYRASINVLRDQLEHFDEVAAQYNDICRQLKALDEKGYKYMFRYAKEAEFGNINRLTQAIVI